MKAIDLFVMAGQSNMQGWMGDAAQYHADTELLDRNIRFYWVTPGYSSSSNAWKTMQAQGGRFSAGHFGPEVTFARFLLKNGFRPAIFKYSLGATGLAKDWRGPGENGLYDAMVAEYKKAALLLVKHGYTVRVRAFIWIQGENDAATKDLAEGYYARLCLLIKDLRENVVKNPDLPVILGIDEQHPFVKTNPIIIAAHKKFADENHQAVFTSMRGLPKADSSHLTPAGLAVHGKRLFEAFDGILNKRVVKNISAQKEK